MPAIPRRNLAAPALAALATAACGEEPARIALEEISLPPGFVIELVTDEVPNARSLAWGEAGTLFVGTRTAGNVYAVTMRDGAVERVRTIAEGMNMPNGVAVRDGDLYLAEVHRVLRYPDIERRLDDVPEPEVVAEYPTDRHHGWKYIAFGPDGALYVPIGAPCNICNEEGYAVITALDVDSGEREIHAHGVRNTVGFTWHPETGELWFTDNGRDYLGNDLPPDELNRAPRAGLHFGYPYCHGGDIADPEFGGEADCEEFAAPAQNLGPHVAALGVKFYTAEQFPPEYRGQIFIAEHGSWNRDEPIGYRVTLVRLEEGGPVSYEPFAEGWLRADGNAWGRPVDLLLDGDGSFLLSDDAAGAIYRIRYAGGQDAAGMR